jgi:maltose alpha-D-glucosyltransferase/alpha-amylase
LISREGEILKRQAALLDRQVVATRTRCHGDYHLGQVLVTGDDFLIIDFEGEPARTLDERRAKASPLRDVAGMLRSFHYAAHASLARQTALSADDRSVLEPWEKIWAGSATRVFREAYLTTARGASFIPAEVKTLAMLFQLYLLEKVVYEICYELNNRPDWIGIPLRGIMRILIGNKWT